MNLPACNINDLVGAGAHLGHKTHRWNPKMQPYIFDERNGLHILDMTQTVPMLYRVMSEVRDVVSKNGRVLFVGTKRQASRAVADSAELCSQYYVNHRWLGGMMTNWKTVANSIKRLEALEEELAAEDSGLTKKEQLNKQREYDKLIRGLGGVRTMGGLPDILFVIDTNIEKIAVREANRLKIPVAAIIDSNSSPEGITYPIPGNDDATNAVKFYCDLIAQAALQGLEASQQYETGEQTESSEAEASQVDSSQVESAQTSSSDEVVSS